MGVDEDLFGSACAAFNARDIEAVISLMHPEVRWANGMEGGYVYGREGVREYWNRQWELVDPRVDPQGVGTDEAGKVIVDVHQVVRDLDGNILVDGKVRHVYDVEDGLIRSMEIREFPT